MMSFKGAEKGKKLKGIKRRLGAKPHNSGYQM
jgi:hypothetical protein